MLRHPGDGRHDDTCEARRDARLAYRADARAYYVCAHPLAHEAGEGEAIGWLTRTRRRSSASNMEPAARR